MDRFGIERAMLGFKAERGDDLRAITEHPDRFFGCYSIDPNQGMDGVRELVRAHEAHGVKAAMAFPAGYLPQVAINDKKMYPSTPSASSSTSPSASPPASAAHGCRRPARR